MRSWKMVHFWFVKEQTVYRKIFPHVLRLGIRSRSFFFFGCTNPSLKLGGLISPKSEIMRYLDPRFLPTSILVPGGQAVEKTISDMKEAGIGYPAFVKPNVGERGYNAEDIRDESDLRCYFKQYGQRDTLVQELVTHPLEFGVLYYKYPGQELGQVSSICQKEFITVTGDGQKTLLELIKEDDAAMDFLDLPMYLDYHRRQVDRVPALGESVQLTYVGGSGRGVRIIDRNDLISDKVTALMHRLVSTVPEFYYGRFDLKARSESDLETGENLVIMELNGVYSTPLHCVDRSFSMEERLEVLKAHWNVVFQIAKANRKRGFKPPGFFRSLKAMLRYAFGIEKRAFLRQEYRRKFAAGPSQ